MLPCSGAFCEKVDMFVVADLEINHGLNCNDLLGARTPLRVSKGLEDNLFVGMRVDKKRRRTIVNPFFSFEFDRVVNCNDTSSLCKRLNQWRTYFDRVIIHLRGIVVQRAGPQENGSAT